MGILQILYRLLVVSNKKASETVGLAMGAATTAAAFHIRIEVNYIGRRFHRSLPLRLRRRQATIENDLLLLHLLI